MLLGAGGAMLFSIVALWRDARLRRRTLPIQDLLFRP
jgi:hypothetical protein